MRALLAGVAAFALTAIPATAQDTAERPAVEEQIGGGGRPVGANWARSPVIAQHGMAATAHPLATQIALDVLKDGGSAVDAAIAANAALGLMEPTGNGIGGDLFAIIYDPATGELHGINGSGRSPRNQTLAQLREKLGEAEALPPYGALPITVPGTVDAWFAMHERFGRRSMAANLAPTISYAREGHPIAPVIGMYLARSLKAYSAREDQFDFSNARQVWFADGNAPEVGEIFRNPDLADTLEAIARDGRDAFYDSALTDGMIDYLQAQGSAFTRADFAGHSSEWVEPACVGYKDGYELCELPPNSQGFAALQMVNILKNIDLSQWERGSAEALHYMVEAKRLAYADVARFYLSLIHI